MHYFARALTAKQMREFDARATQKYAIPSVLLMENAGRAVFQAAADVLDDVEYAYVVVICGQGNNGGDGFVAARHLHNAGALVKIFYFGDRQAAEGDALINIEIAEKIGLDIDNSRDIDKLEEAIANADLVIDALLGTGIKGELRGDAPSVISCMNKRGETHLIAVDLPSGIDSDTGGTWWPKNVLLKSEPAVRADTTVTLAYPKLGPIINPDTSFYMGNTILADIGIPRGPKYDYEDGDDSCVYVLDSPEPLHLKCRYPSAHKGNFGHLAVVAGSVGMTGAATLSAEAALRAGAGLVTVAVPESLNDIMEVKITEAMTIPVPEGNSRAFGMASLDGVMKIINKCDGLVIGPGFGRDPDTIEFTLELLSRLEKPAVVDADALYAISKDLSVLKRCKAPLVLTPHPGEMATLLGITNDEVQSNRLDIARKFAVEHEVTLVLKGARTIIAEPTGSAFVNTTGTPGMASGGVGDVLTGLIGGLMVQEPGLEQWICVTTAVYSHGKAGELAAEELGMSAMLASDVICHIPEVLKELECGD